MSVLDVEATKPVEDSVPQVDNAIAVGEDLEFQRRWWKFERAIWVFFAVLLVADALGAFGRGWLAKAKREAADGSLHLQYERVERANTPSIMTLRFDPSVVRDGELKLFVSQSIVKELGAQRVVPQPRTSTLGGGGITYSFSATGGPMVVEIALEPSFPGVHEFSMRVESDAEVKGKVVVVP